MTKIVDKPHGPVGEREMQKMYGPAHAAVTLTKDDTIRLQQAEIERLRGLVEECAVFLKEDETPAQRIERERADTEAVLNLLLKEKRKTKKLQDKIDRWQGDAECLDRSLTERNAEIERLRGLLRETFDGLDDYWVTTKEGVSWILRVNEALGDE